MLLLEQLIVYLSGVPQEVKALAKWASKMRKSYKALRIMEAHKTAEPRFARTLKLIYPHLDKLRELGHDNDSIDEEDNHTSMSVRENNLNIQDNLAVMGD